MSLHIAKASNGYVVSLFNDHVQEGSWVFTEWHKAVEFIAQLEEMKD